MSAELTAALMKHNEEAHRLILNEPICSRPIPNCSPKDKLFVSPRNKGQSAEAAEQKTIRRGRLLLLHDVFIGCPWSSTGSTVLWLGDVSTTNVVLHNKSAWEGTIPAMKANQGYMSHLDKRCKGQNEATLGFMSIRG
jgi:hypothetical protein